jgi:hypothetical protein
MSEETMDLFIEHEELMETAEQRAAELEITVDYYLMEFV